MVAEQAQDERIRVALVCTELGVGGAERCVARLATGLCPEVFEVEVFVLAERPDSERDGLLALLDDHEIEVHFQGLRSWRQFLRGRRSLKADLSTFSPHVVQSFLFHGNVMALQCSPDGTPVSTGIRVADPRRWRHWVERWFSRRASRIVCVSQSVKSFCVQQARFPSNKLAVIPNGIPLDEIRAEPLSTDRHDGRRTLLCVGRLDYQKGYDWLLPNWKRWSVDFPHHDLVIAGEGPQRGELEDLIERLGLAGRVELLGQRKDVANLLATADVLLLPSRWEGMPNVVLEAMAAGRPVLASRVEGVIELLGKQLADRQSATFGNSDQWRHQLQDLLAPESGSALGAANRSRVEQHFSSQRMVERYAALFRELSRSV